MKRLFVVMAFAMVCFSSSGQEIPYKFMGISLGIDIESFSKSLENKGFKYKSEYKGCKCFNGSILGDDRNVYVYYDSQYGVHQVKINLGTSSVSGYEELKEALKRKYKTWQFNSVENDYLYNELMPEYSTYTSYVDVYDDIGYFYVKLSFTRWLGVSLTLGEINLIYNNPLVSKMENEQKQQSLDEQIDQL